HPGRPPAGFACLCAPLADPPPPPQRLKEGTMSAPVTPPLPTDTGQLGPGVLKIGETGSEIDVSCYVNNAQIEWSDSATDPTTKLCGAVRAGVTTFTSQLTGNIDV